MYLCVTKQIKPLIMKKRHDYRNHIKQLNKEGLIAYINQSKDRIVEWKTIGIDCTREGNMLSYALEKLKKLNN
jgi:hypothetical protein